MLGRVFVVVEEVGFSLLGFIIVLMIVFTLISNKNNASGYIATNTVLYEYSKIEDKPDNKYIRALPVDTVICIEKVIKKSYITWIKGYRIENNKAVETIVLVPEIIKDISQYESKYFTYSTESVTWKKYNDYVNNYNDSIMEKYAVLFKNKTTDLMISYSDDPVFLESNKSNIKIINTWDIHTFGSINQVDNREYYVPKKNYRKLKKISNSLEIEYEKELLQRH